jgi:hypothetical protein
MEGCAGEDTKQPADENLLMIATSGSVHEMGMHFVAEMGEG